MSMSDAPHPSCHGELVPVVVEGDEDPVAALITNAEYPGITLEQLEPMFDPARWPQIADFWCSMHEESAIGSQVRTFLEIVASDCGGSARLSTRLDFIRRNLEDGSVALEYWLSDDQSAPADGLVVVDEGSIIVETTPDGAAPGVRVRTTKRIRFIEPMDGAHLAMTACALGWDGAADAFVYGAEDLGPA